MTDEFVSIDLNSYNRVENKLRRAASDGAKWLDDEVGEFSRKQRRRLKDARYPAKRPGQKYVRTGRLANSWRADKRADAQWTISNTAKYSGYVVGREKQAWMHKNRWWIFEDEMAKSTPELTKALAKRVVDELG
jgi:hypothetical protein